jgi:NADH-quinone oxidoreductase subunit N
VSDVIEQVESIRMSFGYFVPEILLSLSIVALLVAGFFKGNASRFHLIAALGFSASLLLQAYTRELYSNPVSIFNEMLRSDAFSAFLKMLVDVAGILTVAMTWRLRTQERLSEYYALLLTVALGAHLLMMSTNLVMVFLSLEMVSLSSYALTGFLFTKSGAEGSLKYFLFGSVASAAMLYGFTFLYGLTGTLDYSSKEFAAVLLDNRSMLLLFAGCLSLAGFFYKMAAAPLHPWAPDVYEAAPMPVVAFFSVVPKLAGVAILTRFILALNVYGQAGHDWQFVICFVTMLTLVVGNFSALWQQRPKRLMAYSSIGQSGFLLVGVVALIPAGIKFMMFYSGVFLLANYLVFFNLQVFESLGIEDIKSFAGTGRKVAIPSILLLIGFVALTGLPPTAGFTAKLFVFSSVWDSYQASDKPFLLWLLIFGLINTVIALFYYVRIPFFAFVKKAQIEVKSETQTFENSIGIFLGIVILLLFFIPDLLMRWINKINFVL